MNEAALKKDVAEHSEAGSQIAVADASSIVAVISRAASDPKTDVEKLERLMALYERVTAKQAEQQFTESMNSAQAKMPTVLHNAENTHTHSTYADLEAISKAVDPVIQEFGFSLSYGTGKSELQGHYRVTCRVAHKAGHSVEYHADVPADGAGAQGKANKNATQAFGSTMTYGRRYLKCMIFDIKTGEQDDDGLAASKAELPRLSADRGRRYLNFAAIEKDIDNASDRVLTNMETWITDECNWMPNGWQSKLLERIRERDEEAERKTQEAVSANESLDRQFADTMREDLPPATDKAVKNLGA